MTQGQRALALTGSNAVSGIRGLGRRLRMLLEWQCRRKCRREERRMPGIIVRTDGSAHTRRALEWAIREAEIGRTPPTVFTGDQQRPDVLGDQRRDRDPMAITARPAMTRSDMSLPAVRRSRIPPMFPGPAAAAAGGPVAIPRGNKDPDAASLPM